MTSRTQIALVSLACSAPAAADIIPSWRINPINAAAVAANQDLADAGCLSLLVTLTGGRVTS